MKLTLALLCLTLPSLATAQDALADMAGNWAGQGEYLDRNIQEDIRCRLTIASDDTASSITGTCASARRKEDFDLSVQRLAAGQLRSTRRDTFGEVTLTGALDPNGFQLSGTRAAEQTDVTLRLTEPNTLAIDITTTSPDRTQSTTVSLFRR